MGTFDTSCVYLAWQRFENEHSAQNFAITEQHNSTLGHDAYLRRIEAKFNAP
jgi:hypothetical protein